MNHSARRFIRFEGPHPRNSARRLGVFALANGLGTSGVLSPADHAWWRAANDFGNAAYVDPETATPGVYRDNPTARAWFKTSARHLVSYTRGYLVLLARYGVDCDVLQTDSPGQILYEDEVQVVAITL